MSLFKKGDLIKCIDDRGSRDLARGCVYRFDKYADHDPDLIFVDSGSSMYFAKRFELFSNADPKPDYPAPASGYPDGNPKTAIGLTKPSFSNVPAPALLPMMKAFADGKQKYGRFNWREKGVTASVYYDAAQRHLMAYWDGEDRASDSGVHHLGHAMACLAIILDAERHQKLNDDRNGQGEFSKLVAEMTEKVTA